MEKKLIPGTQFPFSGGGEAFALFRQMVDAAGGLTLSQICALTGLEGTTIQNWVKRGWVAKPVGKKYGERQLARILIINALRNSLQLEQIAGLLRYVNGSAEDESDDIIGEALLFNYFCSCVNALDVEQGLSHEKIEKAVSLAVRGYKGPYPQAEKKLKNALRIMVQAFLAAEIRRDAEGMLRELLL